MVGEEKVILSGAAFDVPADNYEEFDQEIDPSKLGAKLVQVNTLKGTIRRYQFYAPRHLLLSFVEKKKSRSKDFRVDLAWLSAEPKHTRIITWKWLYGALATGAVLGVSIYLAIAEIVKMEYCLLAGVISLTACLIFALIFIYKIRDEFVFRSYYGDADLFLLENRKPSQQKFDKFIVALQKSIDRAHSSISVADRLIGELKMCRRLKDEGIINDATYTKARSAIFSHERYSAQ